MIIIHHQALKRCMEQIAQSVGTILQLLHRTRSEGYRSVPPVAKIRMGWAHFDFSRSESPKPTTGGLTRKASTMITTAIMAAEGELCPSNSLFHSCMPSLYSCPSIIRQILLPWDYLSFVSDFQTLAVL